MHLVTVNGLPVQRACGAVGLGRVDVLPRRAQFTRGRFAGDGRAHNPHYGQESLGLLEVL